MGCAITVVVFGKKPWITASSTVVCDACVVDVDSSLLNLASGQVAVLNCLGKVVLKGRFAEVGYVVGRDRGVLFSFSRLFVAFQLARSGC